MIYRANPYFMMNRTGVNDDRLTYKAIGILAYLLSKPDGWTIDESDLCSRHANDLTSVRSGLKELEECGYIEIVSAN